MKSNPILEEVWRIKDELDRQAGHDLHRLCENTRKWAESHPRGGPVVHTGEELRALLEQEERKAAQSRTPTLREEPPPT